MMGDKTTGKMRSARERAEPVRVLGTPGPCSDSEATGPGPVFVPASDSRKS